MVVVRRIKVEAHLWELAGTKHLINVMLQE